MIKLNKEKKYLFPSVNDVILTMLVNDQNLSNLSEIPASNDPFTIRILKKFPKQRDREGRRKNTAKGRAISKGFVNSYRGIKRGGRTIAMTGRDEHRIPATRFHDSLRGRCARRICREIWNLVVGARARGSFEDVVVRRAPGFTTASSIERERDEKEYT